MLDKLALCAAKQGEFETAMQLPAMMFEGQTPHLQSLQLENVFPRWDSNIFDGLRKLDIEISLMAGIFSPIIDMLPSMDQLLDVLKKTWLWVVRKPAAKLYRNAGTL